MKIILKSVNGLPYLIIKYTKKEYKAIDERLQQMGLEKKEVYNLFDKGIKGVAYVTNNEEIKKIVNNSFSDIMSDNINRVFFDGYKINVGVVRIVPDQNYELHIPIDKFVTIKELNEAVTILTDVFSKIFNTVTEAKINIKTNIA
jgi:hypothetical protein